MEKESNKNHHHHHVLLLPFFAQGHINPMLQFAKRLVSKGFKATLVTNVYISKSMHVARDCKVGFETISDGFDETGPSAAASAEMFINIIRGLGSKSLGNLINKYTTSSSPFTCLVSDAILPWGLDVGKEFGLITASLYTQAGAVNALFYHVKQGNLRAPVAHPTVSLPGLPELALADLPSSLVITEPDPTGMNLLVDQFSNLEKADWLLFNTFDHLETQVLTFMWERLRIRTIGPTTPSMYLDKRVEGDTENSLNIFNPSDGRTCMEWLNAKETGSVVYISFGSIAEQGQEQMEELIRGIQQTNKNFIWVLREKELPPDFMLDKVGLVVPWCSQVEVLAHQAVGCFLTHCGWNSTLEALSLGVPMVAMPHIWDQFTNAKLVQDVWGTGIRVRKDDKGIVTREEIELCIREVMEEGERGKLIRIKAAQWRKAAKDAVDVGGTSDSNIEDFVASIIASNKC